MKDLQNRLSEKKITVNFTDTLKNWLGEIGYDPIYGARPLKRCIQKHLYDFIAKEIISGKLHEGSNVTIDYKNDEVRLDSIG